MFNNLIESSSHRSEFKRRGSFFLFTTATYALLFVIAGVVSIYAYDARLEDQNTEIVTLLSPVDFSTQAPATSHNTTASKGNNTKQAFYERKVPMVSVAHPEIAPEKISTTPNVNLPLPDAGIIKFSGRDVDLSVPGGSGGPGDGMRQTNSSRSIVPVIEIPPPAMVQKPVPKVINKRIINSEAIELPKPLLFTDIHRRSTGQSVGDDHLQLCPAIVATALSPCCGDDFQPPGRLAEKW